MMTIAREKIPFDVLFVGGGPANLAGAIHLMDLAKKRGLDLEVALIEKGADMGAHALSGAVMNPMALKELIPDYIDKGCPIEADVRGDAFYFLTEKGAFRLPMVPKEMRNEGFHIMCLSRLVGWLAAIAEDMGVNIFPGFAGKEVLFEDDGKTIAGIRTGDQGLGKDGKPKANFEPGIDILAKVTVFGEGTKGSLMREVDLRLGLFEGKLPQTFETGIKEVIQLPEENFFTKNSFNDIHTLGHPVGLGTHGGGFIYEMKDNRVSLGLVVGLGYENPSIDLYDLFISFKKHPFVENIIAGGQVLEQGARVLGNGGFFTIPKLAVNGAVFVGASASMLNAPALKGIHTAMKSAMLASESIIEALAKEDFSAQTLDLYETLFHESWLKQELYRGRNFAQAVSRKMPAKAFHLAAQFVTKGRGLLDRMGIERDCDTLRPLKKKKASAPHASETADFDGTLYLDKLTGIYMSKTQHREDQPCHLIVKDKDLCVETCFPTYGSPCTRFCPGNVYEIDTDETTQQRKLKLNPSNCLHCKTCEIKDPYENIIWTCPEGGGGPKYTLM